MDFSYKKMAIKGLKYFTIFLVSSMPVILSVIPPGVTEMTIPEFLTYISPSLNSITLGAVIVMILNYLKVKSGMKIG